MKGTSRFHEGFVIRRNIPDFRKQVHQHNKSQNGQSKYFRPTFVFVTLELIRDKVTEVLEMATGISMSARVSALLCLVSTLTLDTDTILACD
jgi:hypothetical protein